MKLKFPWFRSNSTDNESIESSSKQSLKAMFGVFFNDSGLFMLRSINDERDTLVLQLKTGGISCYPLTGHWQKDKPPSFGLFEPTRSIFLHKFELTDGLPDLAVRFGPMGKGWLPVNGDWDGDGVDGLGLYNQQSARFHLINKLEGNNPDVAFQLGVPSAGCIPFACDIEGSKSTKVGVFNPANKEVVIVSDFNDGKDPLVLNVPWVESHYLPISLDWKGVGYANLIFYDPDKSEFHFTDSWEAPLCVKSIPFGPQGLGLFPVCFEMDTRL